MVTWQQLRDLKRTEFEEAADGWGEISNRAGANKDRVDREMLAKIRHTQKGDTANKAIARLQKLSDNFHYISVECGLIRTALNGLAAELAEPQRKLKSAIERAAELKFTIEANGRVKYPATSPYAPDLDGVGEQDNNPPRLPAQNADPNQGKAQAIADDIHAAVTEATRIDAEYAPVLRKLKTTGGLEITAEMWVDARNDMQSVRDAAGDQFKEKDIPKGKSPADNAAWWKGLTEEQRAEYVSLYPDSIGKLDGLPSAVRDDANRIVFTEAHAKVQQDIAAIGPEPQRYKASGKEYPKVVETDEWRAWNEKRKRIDPDDNRHKLDGIMNDIEARFALTGKDGLPEAYLLGFSTEGNGRSIIANGNPDTAAHTAVFVPGTYTELSKTEQYTKHMVNLWRESNALSPGENVSTITWIGYDAPQSIVPAAMSKSYAEDAAPHLTRFLDGLQTSQGGADASHTTVIGHSYGSTVVGKASLEDGKLAADDIVAAGSPGMLVGHADDLDVGKDHVWAEAAGFLDDQVPTGGKLAGLGGDSDLTPWVEWLPFGYAWSSNVPSDEDFGGHVMKNDANDHGDYWRPGSVSMKNQARVVTGNYGDVEHE
ncbi:alpha/beta hydrolase [Streptomyces sp. URMC 123]|uniref:alpha/beta hydrolase n=1 Tax=Streptomyces sp. URMC 123 TaxID=3423403 RepID=UPI003F1942C5